MAFLLNPAVLRILLPGLLIVAVLGAAFAYGNKYGSNARKWRACQAETARRNAAIERVNRSEEIRREAEERDRAVVDEVFREVVKDLPPCILTAEQAAALNLIRD